MIIILFSLLLCFSTQLYAECSDLNYSECSEYPEYCEWNDESEVCQDIGGGGGDVEYGPYQFSSISQSDGMRNGPHYLGADLYYPLEAVAPFKTIVIGSGWGGVGAYMSNWAEFFASHGFIAATIDYNDAENDSHFQRGEAMLDLIETIKQENLRLLSPVYDKVDTLKFAAAGHSISGGSAVNAGLLDSTQVLDAIISLNPTVIFEDCVLCAGSEYCICLVPELLEEQVVPTLIISGENEVLELPEYEGMLGIDIYNNHPQSTTKMIYEIENGGHSSAEFPQTGSITNLSLNWLKYHLMDSLQVCNQLIEENPENASVFSTTLECITDSVESCILGEVYVSEGHNSGDPEDYIEIYNSGLNDCSLEGFQLDDNEELDDFTFGNIIIPARGYWIGYEDENNSFSSGLSANGDIIVFADSTGSSLIVELEVVQETDSISYSQSFDANGNGCYTIPTPGSLNGECVTLSTLKTAIPPREYSLSQNYPNPFNPTTQIRYDLPEDALVSISIYDVMGRKIKSLSNANQTAGYHSLQWDATNDLGEIVSTGMYFYTLRTKQFSETNKMLFLN
jgi:hypothetical protein